MEHLGWEHLSSLAFPSLDSSSVELPGGIGGQEGFDNYDVQTREQALEIIGNLCSATEEDVELTLMHLGKDRLMEALESIIWQEVDASVLMAVASILINIAAGNDEHRRLILDRPNLVDAILYFMVSDLANKLVSDGSFQIKADWVLMLVIIVFVRSYHSRTSSTIRSSLCSSEASSAKNPGIWLLGCSQSHLSGSKFESKFQNQSSFFFLDVGWLTFSTASRARSFRFSAKLGGSNDCR